MRPDKTKWHDRANAPRWVAGCVALVFVMCLPACQSFSDGARQVSSGAQDLGKKMAAPFRRAPSQPSFGDRSPGAAGQRDPFLPPPNRPDDDDFGYRGPPPNPLNTVTLGKPTFLPRPAAQPHYE